MKKNLLILALKLIKNECVISYNCGDCPFCIYVPDGGTSCGIRQTIPSEWSLIDDEPCKEKLML